MEFAKPSVLRPVGSARCYSLAIVVTIVALFLRVLIAPFFSNYVPYPMVWAAIAFSAWCCGLGPSLVSIAISVAGIWFWFPGLSHTYEEQNGLAGVVTFAVFAAFIAALGNRSRRSQIRREAAECDALRSRRLFDTFMDNSPAIVFMKDRDGRFMYLNRTARNRFGIKEGAKSAPTIPAQNLAEHQENDWKVLQAGRALEFIEYTDEPDGRHAWLSVKFPVVDPERGTVIGGKSFDVTDRVKAEEALLGAHRELEQRVQERTAELTAANQGLRDLSARLLQVRDEEHRRMARELHDSVGQLLAALSMNMSLLSRDEGAKSPEVQRAIIESQDLLNQASREIRTISHLLHPPLLDEMGLASALQWYVDGFAGRSGIKVDVAIAPDIERLPADVEVALFRLVQECLTNIHRHSGSRTAEIRVHRNTSWICVEVEDAGTGIPSEKRLQPEAGGHSGVGIRGMRERIRLLGGNLEIDSSPSGTLIRASLPAQQPASHSVKSDPEESECNAA